eukprot:m.288525 g.288525  ORF g.288525 m.288525 type:complete len:152 (-) comp11976_c0_seq1:230-685(-)
MAYEDRDPLNPNEIWVNAKGFRMYYVVVVALVHLALLSLPFFSTELVWTLTNVSHAVVTWVVFHWIKGTPFTTFDSGDASRLTQWEQIDHGVQFSTTRKFLIVAPIILFFLTVWYCESESHFWINLVFCLFSVVPKLPYFHKVRLFGINRY